MKRRKEEEEKENEEEEVCVCVCVTAADTHLPTVLALLVATLEMEVGG